MFICLVWYKMHNARDFMLKQTIFFLFQKRSIDNYLILCFFKNYYYVLADVTEISGILNMCSSSFSWYFVSREFMLESLITAGETDISSHTISSLLLTNKGCHYAQKSGKELPYSDQQKIYSDIVPQQCYKYYQPNRRLILLTKDL